MAAMRRILFASDFSKASRKAFTTAVAMAKTNRASLTIVHVVVPFTPIAPEQYLDAQTWESVAIRLVAMASCPVVTVRSA